MITRPDNWTAVHGVTTQTLIAPQGADAAVIRYRERVRPLRRMSGIVADWKRRHAAVAEPSVGEVERLVTIEGEHAGLVAIDGSVGGKPIRAFVGAVFGDDFYACVEALVLQPEQFESVGETVRGLTLSDQHALGHRRRRFEYTAPAGWQPITRGFATDWVAPKFPLEWGLIVAYPATPIEPSDEVPPEVLVSRAIERGFAVDTEAAPREVTNDNGLTGFVHEMVGSLNEQRMLRGFVTLTDHKYLYSGELMARTADVWPAHKDAFGAFFRSIVPIPQPTSSTTSIPFTFWAD